MLVTNEVKNLITQKLELCIETATKRYGVNLDYPNVIYTKRGTTAGTANFATNTINLNPVLLMNNINAFLNRTVPHEMAHLITGTIYPETNISSFGKKRSPHGTKWKSVMLVLGADPSRCHSYDTYTVRKKIVKHEYVCENCGNSVMLGVRRHKTQQEQAKYGINSYYHTGCKGSKLILKTKMPQIVQERPKQLTNTKQMSKKNIAISTYASMRDKPKAEVVARFIQFGMTEKGASTYYSNVKSGKWK